MKRNAPLAGMRSTVLPKRFPIVGIGGSAGGLDPFLRLLEKLPAETGMAFVFVQHLYPEHKSSLPRILAGATAMVVREAMHGLSVTPNKVYVIPPKAIMTLAGGRLRIRVWGPAPPPHLTIDCFFESLAKEQQQRSIGIIFSGNGSDGLRGLEAIRRAGGVTFAQDRSAEYSAMPRHAISARCIDHILAPAAIARELTRLAKYS